MFVYRPHHCVNNFILVVLASYDYFLTTKISRFTVLFLSIDCYNLKQYVNISLSLPMSTGELRSVLDKITKHSTETASDSLQELITFVQFANDECDYGMGLELGIDLFCYGDPFFHGKIQHLLSLAYDLLDRPEYEKIIQQHLKHRQKPKFVLKTN